MAPETLMVYYGYRVHPQTHGYTIVAFHPRRVRLPAAEGEAATGGAMRLQASEAAGGRRTGQWAASTAAAMDTSAARPYRSCDCCPVPTARG
uniref:Uncharacterized protein n=1 Tax=Oryza glaberrima TaxID=4538 RepID=I1Q2D7_ORYGL